MLKKAIPLVLLSSFFLTACSAAEKAKNETKDKNNKIEISQPTTPPNSNLTLVDKSITYSPYLNLGNLIFFPDKENNNKLSTTEKSTSNSYVLNDNIKDTFNYPVESLITIDNSIYFSNTSDNNSLYKLDYQRNEFTKVNNNSVYNLTSQSKELYYINRTDNNKLYHYNLANSTSYSLSDDSCGKFIINGNSILYQNLSDGAKLYSISIDGNNRKKLTDNSVDSFTVYSGQILFINSDENNSLYKLDVKSEKTNKIASINGTELKNSNNKLYFINIASGNNLCSLSVDLNKNEAKASQITTDSINQYYLNDNEIFLDKTLDVNKTYVIKQN